MQVVRQILKVEQLCMLECIFGRFYSMVTTEYIYIYIYAGGKAAVVVQRSIFMGHGS